MDPVPDRPVSAALLRRLRDTLRPIRDRGPEVPRALDVLERDLLPRSAGGDVHLVCGIVGPNNAGKSSLFNALVGRPLSPASPTGGATRRLLGAAAPALLARLEAEPTLARFPMRRVARVSPPGVEAVLAPGADAAELLVVAEESLPPGLLLIDTPDFDSILDDNRLASESLLTVADLVVAVVTRHSYQNREVVRFLGHWLEHQRPWILCYNEAPDEDVARRHAAVLARQVGQPPLAVFWAPHDLRVQEGSRSLEPQQVALLSDDAGALLTHTLRTGSGATDLRSVLFDVACIGEVKSRAFAASLGRLRDALDSVLAHLTAEAARTENLLAVLEGRALLLGRQLAAAAMPGAPFIAAFRVVLDRRSNFLSRAWRTALRGVRQQLELVTAAVRGRRPRAEEEAEHLALAEVEGEALRIQWPALWEDLVRDFGAEARHPARRDCPPAIAAAFDADLTGERRNAALATARGRLKEDGAELDSFQRACESLIEEAIEERGFDIDIQAGADLATLAPLALAAAVVVKTGGVGVDIAIAGGGALSSFLLEKYTHLLGSGILAAARRRWAELRGRQWASLLLEAATPQAGRMLRESVTEAQRARDELRTLRRELA